MRLIVILLFFFFFTVDLCLSSNTDSLLIDKYLKDASSLMRSNPDSAYTCVQKAKDIAKGKLSGRFLSMANQTLGFYYINSEDFGKATECFLSALAIEEKRNDMDRIASLNDNLGYIYLIFEKFNKSINYYQKALDIYTTLKDTIGIAKVHSHIGGLQMSREFCEPRTDVQKREDYLTAIPYYKKALALCTKINNQDGIINAYHNLGVIHNKLREPEKAIEYFKPVLDHYIKTEDRGGIVNLKRALGKTYLLLKQYSKSIDYYNESIIDSKKYKLTGGIQFLYEDAAYAYDLAGDYKNAKDYYVKYMILRDSIYNSEKTKQIFELETRYQTEKKEKEILTLTVIKKKKNFFIYTLISVFVLVCVTGLFVINRIRSKRTIAEQQNLLKEQKIKELESEQQLIATQSVLRGEETERVRLARDLHDGLGGLLSGVKLTLTNLKGNYVLPRENVDKFDHALELLNTSINEMRRISHNMMPEALVKFGLKDAIQDFINRIDKQKGIRFNFQFFGNEKRFESSLETATYRIVLELVNNAIKHSQAKQIIVQLVQDEKRLHLTVQDDGIGFDIAAISQSKSSGIRNIKDRVESLRGNLDIASKPGKGSEITVEFSIL